MTAAEAQNLNDLKWMQRALELARGGLGHVEPNPLVGAVVADGAEFISEGRHERFGEAHAEVNALRAAGPRARGATIYVTLEPCCHQGKTPPCTEAIIRSGIRRAVVAMRDPFDKVCGRGLQQLRDAGLEVLSGVHERQTRMLNQPFIKLVTTGRPYVTAKWAMTLDGRLAAATGDSRWISGPASRRLVHSMRSRMDAIIIGSGTARVDDPQLTVRLENDAPPAPSTNAPDYGRRPARVVIDPNLTLSAESELVRSARQTPLLLVTNSALACDAAAIDRLTAAGAEIIHPAEADTESEGKIAVDALLLELGRRGMTNVLVEGGRRTLESFFAAESIDALAVFIAAKLIGGEPHHVAPGPCGLEMMSNALSLLQSRFTPVGDDLLVTGLLREY